MPSGWIARPGRRVSLPGAWVLLATATVLAEPAARQPVVEVLIAGVNAEVSALAEALNDPLGRLNVALHVRLRRGQGTALDPAEVANPSARATPAVARMWFDLTEPGQAALYITDGGWKRIYVRRVLLPHGLDEVAREELTYIARSSVETLLAGGQIGVTREEFQRQLPSATGLPPAEAATPVPSPHWGIAAGVSYETRGFAPASPVTHGPGVGVSGSSLAGVVGPVVIASAQWDWTRHVRTELVTARLDGGALRLGAGADWHLGRSFRVCGLVGGGVDLVHVDPGRAADGTVQPSAPFWATDPVLRGSLALGLDIGELTAWLTLGTDVAARSSRYVVLLDGARVDVLTPWRWRPWARVELWWEFWRSDR